MTDFPKEFEYLGIGIAAMQDPDFQGLVATYDADCDSLNGIQVIAPTEATPLETAVAYVQAVHAFLVLSPAAQAWIGEVVCRPHNSTCLEPKEEFQGFTYTFSDLVRDPQNLSILEWGIHNYHWLKNKPNVLPQPTGNQPEKKTVSPEQKQPAKKEAPKEEFTKILSHFYDETSAFLSTLIWVIEDAQLTSVEKNRLILDLNQALPKVETAASEEEVHLILSDIFANYGIEWGVTPYEELSEEQKEAQKKFLEAFFSEKNR